MRIATSVISRSWIFRFGVRLQVSWLPQFQRASGAFGLMTACSLLVESGASADRTSFLVEQQSDYPETARQEDKYQTSDTDVPLGVNVSFTQSTGLNGHCSSYFLPTWSVYQLRNLGNASLGQPSAGLCVYGPCGGRYSSSSTESRMYLWSGNRA